MFTTRGRARASRDAAHARLPAGAGGSRESGSTRANFSRFGVLGSARGLAQKKSGEPSLRSRLSHRFRVSLAALGFPFNSLCVSSLVVCIAPPCPRPTIQSLVFVAFLLRHAIAQRFSRSCLLCFLSAMPSGIDSPPHRPLECPNTSSPSDSIVRVCCVSGRDS